MILDSAALIDFFISSDRLPWRDDVDPYKVWIAEIMAQQTIFSVAARRYSDWLLQFPSIQILAKAPLEGVLLAWEGLGYYSRAKNVHATANIVAISGWPADLNRLTALPGIGVYTAKAILCRSFGRPVLAVDANVNRVLARLEAVARPDAKDAARWEAQLKNMMQEFSPGTINQALMRFGQLICKKNPECERCFLNSQCAARVIGREKEFPLKTNREKIINRESLVAIFMMEDGMVRVEKRSKGIGEGMYSFPRYAMRDFESLQKRYAPVVRLQERTHLYTKYRERLIPYLFITGDTPEHREGLDYVPMAALGSLPFLSVYRKMADELYAHAGVINEIGPTQIVG